MRIGDRSKKFMQIYSRRIDNLTVYRTVVRCASASLPDVNELVRSHVEAENRALIAGHCNHLLHLVQDCHCLLRTIQFGDRVDTLGSDLVGVTIVQSQLDTIASHRGHQKTFLVEVQTHDVVGQDLEWEAAQLNRLHAL